MTAPTRREVLLGLAATVLAVPFASACLPGRESLALGPWSRATRLGRAYLKGAPGEARRETLEESLWQRLSEQPGASTLRDRLRRAIATDFERGDTVQVAGWVLARTECRLCALATLT